MLLARGVSAARAYCREVRPNSVGVTPSRREKMRLKWLCVMSTPAAMSMTDRLVVRSGRPARSKRRCVTYSRATCRPFPSI
jgi:hypothetical protein